MKAFVLEKQDNIHSKPLKLKDIPIRAPAKDETLVKVEACGICHTDLHIIEGDIPSHKLPLVLGHQIIGRIASTNERIGIPWIYKLCGKCFFCRNGKENICEKPLFTGYDVDGGYAEYVIAKKDAVYPIGNVDPVEFAPILCAGVIGYRAFNKTGIKKKEKLGIYGFGASGHIVLQIALANGIEVYVFTRSEKHKKMAKKMGAYWAGNAKDEPPSKTDAGIIFAPAGEIIPLALKHSRKAATLVSAGIYMTDIPKFPYELIYHEREIKTVANSTRNDAKEFIKLAKKIKIKPKTEVFKFKDTQKALIKLKEGKIEGAAVIKI